MVLSGCREIYALNHMQSVSRAVVAVCLLVLGLITNPASAEMSAAAQKFHQQRIAQVPLYDDPELAAYVNRIGQKVAAVSDQPNTEFYFFIRDSDDVNAEAPDHNIVYIDRGLLTMMTSEGQLAAVLAHELGHHIGNHKNRLETRLKLSNIGEFLASVMVGNSGVGRAMDMANNERLLKFKREVELEADELGAKYLYRAGYDPQEMLGMLSVLNDNSRLLGQIQGVNTSYHGVFATHPRSDKRLRAAIDRAGVLPPGEAFRGREEFRKVLAGTVFGPNYTGNKREDQERYTNKSLGITFLYPNDWSRELKGNKIILKDAAKSAQLKITMQKTKDKSLTSQQVLEAKYPDDLTQVKKIDEQATKDLGTVGRRPQQRVAVIQIGRNTFDLQGIAKSNQLTEEQDAQFLEIINSFRRATRGDLSPEEVKRIYFKRLEPGETLTSLATEKRTLGKYTEDYFRVMNGFYPKGEPEPGTYIKLVE